MSPNEASQNTFLPQNHLRKIKNKSLKTIEVSRKKPAADSTADILSKNKAGYKQSMDMFRINALIPKEKYQTIPPSSEIQFLSPKF